MELKYPTSKMMFSFNHLSNPMTQINEYDDNEIVNHSDNLHMNDLLDIRLSRRQTL